MRWTVEHNRFYEVEPDRQLEIEGYEAGNGMQIFDDDLLVLSYNNGWMRYTLLLGWQPVYDPEGSFWLKLYKFEEPENLLISYRTQNKHEIVQKLDFILHEVAEGNIH